MGGEEQEDDIYRGTYFVSIEGTRSGHFACYNPSLKPDLLTIRSRPEKKMEPRVVVDIASDDEEGDDGPPIDRDEDRSIKRKRYGADSPVLIETPLKEIDTPSIVPETRFPVNSDVSVVKCTITRSSNSELNDKFSGFPGVICLDSDNESNEGFINEISKGDGWMNEITTFIDEARKNQIRLCSTLELEDGISRGSEKVGAQSFGEKFVRDDNLCLLEHTDKEPASESDYAYILPHQFSVDRKSSEKDFELEDAACSDHLLGDSRYWEADAECIQIPKDHATLSYGFSEGCLETRNQVEDYFSNEQLLAEQTLDEPIKATSRDVDDDICKNGNAEGPKRKKSTEDKIRLKEERKLKREQEKLRKEALKADAARMKKLQKEKEKWEKGKLASKSIVVEIDANVAEMGLIGGSLLSRLGEKELRYRITSNVIPNSILWKMNVPDEIAELSSECSVVRYILLVFEAEAFCKMITGESIMPHVHRILELYPEFTICYCTNRLLQYINKREQAHYKNPSDNNSWRQPPVEEVLSMFCTHFPRVHSRQCLDEAEIADHIVGLTCSLASCQFRKKLTRLSISANGSHIPKDFFDKNLIRTNVWLKALTAIPKVQPRFAVAIWKKYPTMRSLLNVYMDPNKSVHEKEYLLKDLTTEDLLGNKDRSVGEMCSKRVYRILMAQSGNIKTDEVEDGADIFEQVAGNIDP